MFHLVPKQFGHKIPGQKYRDRPSVYGIIVNDEGRIAAVIDDTKTILPGGGIDKGEGPIDALVREIKEETGWPARVGDRIGEANEFIFAPRQDAFVNKTGVFYLASINGPAYESVVPEHDVIWIAPKDFMEKTNHESHAWAVNTAIRSIHKK